MMHYSVQQRHKSNHRHQHTAVYTQVTQLHVCHQHAQQWRSHHNIRFWFWSVPARFQKFESSISVNRSH